LIAARGPREGVQRSEPQAVGLHGTITEYVATADEMSRMYGGRVWDRTYAEVLGWTRIVSPPPTVAGVPSVVKYTGADPEVTRTCTHGADGSATESVRNRTVSSVFAARLLLCTAMSVRGAT
jgi:hypothetical protein